MKRELSPWGKQCKIQMIMLNKSLADLSRETGLSRTYISSIINGRQIAPKETVCLIGDALHVDAALVE